MRCSVVKAATLMGLLLGFAAKPAPGQQPHWRKWHPAKSQAAKPGTGANASKPAEPAHENPHPPGPTGENGGAGSAQPNAHPNAGAIAALPPPWVEKLRGMPPDQQEKFLQNNRRFQNLPPERQQQILQNLQKWNRLTPAQQDEMRADAKFLGTLTPEQRQQLRREVLPQLQAMTPQRRQLVMQHWHSLRDMTPEERQAALNDPKFMDGLNADEQSVLRRMSSPGAPGGE